MSKSREMVTLACQALDDKKGKDINKGVRLIQKFFYG